MTLKIQCPKCDQRFTVDEELNGKTVECGACDHRFPVEEDYIINERAKVYPGDHKDEAFLDRLGRDVGGVKTSAPSHALQVDAIMPSSAGQKIALGLGMGLILLYSVFFFIGTSENGFFRDVLMNKRIILGAFVGLLGGGLIVFGAKNWRARALLLVITLVAGLFALIMLRPVHFTPYAAVSADEVAAPDMGEEGRVYDEDGIKARVGYFGMQRQIDEMTEKHGASGVDYVVGIYIPDLSGREYVEVEQYLLNSLSIPPSEGIVLYPRNDERDSLLVISGCALDFDTVVRLCDPRLGTATTYPEHRLVELSLSPMLFSSLTGDLLKKLTDPEHPAFFSNNLNELQALNSKRMSDAVTRLANVPPSVQMKHGDKIVPEFVRILRSETDPSLLFDLGKALRIWASGQPAVVNVVTQSVKKWLESDAVIPKSFINYLTDSGSEDAPAIVDLLWGKNPELWSKQYMDLGSGVEPRLISHLEESPLNLKKGAILILAKTGTRKSLSSLEKIKASGDSEVKILAQNAIDSIKSR